MANVTGEAVEDVSSYMTAVWNNFNKDGTESVEHFGDVMTKLGADTAASTEEIAGGLEKFAGIADTIGLSFDYATAAVTTIVDRTRQSEEVVGTALKTIFSRLEGLKLGETLDDGTDLNKYSEGLEKVGVYIKDANGELRDMDDLMDDIGDVWGKLERDEQVALAQTVAGIRQYNQFMSLFDNWDVMEQNLEIAYNADGSLQEQADIYAESWQAARDRVKAALEDVYQNIIDSKTFISLNDVLADIISGVDDFVESIGGIKPIIITIGSLILSMTKDKIGPAINQMIQNIKISTLGVGKVYQSISKGMVEANEEAAKHVTSEVEKQQLTNNTQLLQAKTKLSMVSSKMTSDEKALAEIALEGLKAQQNEVLKLAEGLEKTRTKIKECTEAFKELAQDEFEINAAGGNSSKAITKHAEDLQRRIFREQEKPNSNAEVINKLRNSYNALYNNFGVGFEENASSIFREYVNQFDRAMTTDNMQINSDAIKSQLNSVLDQFRAGSDFRKGFTKAGGSVVTGGDMKAALQDLIDLYPKATTESIDFQKAIKKVYATLNDDDKTAFGNAMKPVISLLEQAEISAEGAAEVIGRMGGKEWDKNTKGRLEGRRQEIEDLEKLADGTQRVQAGFDNFQPSHVITRIEALTSAVSLMGSTTMAITSFKSALDTLNNTDISGIEKISSVLMSGSMFGSSVFSMGRELAPIGRNIKETYDHYNAPNKAIKDAQKQMADWKIAINKDSGRALDAYIDPRIFNRQAASISNITEEEVELIRTQAQAKKSGSALTATIKSLTASFGTMFGPIFLVVGVLAALSAAFIIAYKESHKYREALANAEEKTKQASNAYKEITDDIEEVNSAINNLSSKHDELSELEYGTSEWNTALKEVNDNVSDLVKNYSDLTTGVDYYRDSLGALHLTEEGIEKIEKENQRRERQAKGEVNSAQAAENEARVKAEAEKLAQKYGGKFTITSDFNNLATGGANKTDVLAKVIENINNGNISDFSNDGFESSLATVIGSAEAAVIASEDDLTEALKELAIETQKNTEALLLDIENELLNDPEFKEMLDNIDPEYQAGVLAQAAKEILESEKADDINGKTINDLTDEDREAFAEAHDYDYDISKRKNKQISSTDEEGETTYYTNEDVFKWLKHEEAINASTEALEHYQECVEKTIKIEKGLEKTKKYYDDNKKALKEYFKSGKDSSKEAQKAFEEFSKIAQKDLSETFKELIKDGDFKDLEEVSENLEDVFDSKFIEKNAKLIQKALNGDVEALEELGEKAADKYIIDLDINNKGAKKEINKTWNELKDLIPNDLAVGVELNTGTAVSKAEVLGNQLAAALGSATEGADALRAALALEGFENPTIETEKIPLNGATFTHKGTYFLPDLESPTSLKKVSFDNVVEIPTAMSERVVVKSLGAKTAPVKKTTTTSNNKTTGSPSGKSDNSGGGGSKSKPSKIDYTKRDDIIKRYKRIDDELDDTQRKYDKLNASLDRLYGKSRINQMNKVISTLKKENQQTAQKLKLAYNYLKTDKKSLQKSLDTAYKKAGLKVKGNDFTFDSDGDIKNYYSRLNTLYEELHKREKKLNSITDSDKNSSYKEKKVEPLQEAIEKLKEKIEQYDETKELIEELKNTLRDNLYELQDIAYEKLTYKLEIKLELNDNEIKYLEHFYDKLSENVYKRSEALAKLWSNTSKSMVTEEGGKLQLYQAFLDSINKAGTSALDTSSLQKEINKIPQFKGKTVQEALGLTDEQMKKISQGDYAEALQTVMDGALESAEQLAEYNEQLLEYYSDTLDIVQDKVDIFTDQIDRLSTTLDHYNSVMELLGKNKNYTQINKVNDALVKISKNTYDIAKKTHDAYDGELQAAAKTLSDYEAQWAKSHANITDAAARQTALATDAQYELLKKNYDAIAEKAQESWNAQLESAEAYFEALNTLSQKKLEELRWQFESAFDPAGLGFDSMLNALSGEDTWADLTLTSVNQAYEMNKLLRQVNKDIEKTDNKAAKEKYKNFTKEIEQLKQKTVLSQLDLEIAQAKYKQLQAQIALEEAQNAKSTVRLSRDNEGNYGYVYTADQDAIDDAEQALDDANNDLYNIALKGATNAQRGFIEAYSSYLNELAEVEETYKDDKAKRDAEIARVTEKWQKVIKQYADDYATAVATDSRVIDEDVAAMFKNVITNSEEWKTKTDKLITDSGAIMDDYRTKVSAVYKELGLDADSYATTIGKVTSESQKLADTATTSVIPALEEQAKAVREGTEELAAQRKEVEKLIEGLEQLAETAKNTKKTVSGYEDTETNLTPTEDVSAWNKQIEERVAELKEKYKNDDSKAFMVITDKNGYKHYRIYNPQETKAQVVKQSMEAKWNNVDQSVVDANNAIAEKIAKTDTKAWRVYDMNNGYHYSKVSKERALQFAKNADKKAGYSDEEIEKHDYQVLYYDTGGYTGEWGPGAKLAGLHEKELVLNQDDTKNFLAGISILRDIVKIIDIQAASQGGAVDSVRAASAMPFAQTLEQQVSIKASFPNATNHSEIEQAFDTLINRAAQYANRRD